MKFYITLSILIILFTLQLLSPETDILWSKPNNPLDSADEENNLNAIIPDFLVNDDQIGAEQYFPYISADSSGNFIIIWTDNRSSPNDLYAQRYSSDGTALGSNFKVNDYTGSLGRGDKSISADYDGNFNIVWREERNGECDIYAQRYSSDGTAQGSNFRVNEDTSNASQGSPSISAEGGGNFIIAWADERNGDCDIYAQRYSSDGTALGNNFRVNDDQGNADQFIPSVSAESNGNFIIAWDDDRNGGDDIYAQRYANDGTALGSNFRVNDIIGSVST